MLFETRVHEQGRLNSLVPSTTFAVLAFAPLALSAKHCIS
jgi:hypothetical protein